MCSKIKRRKRAASIILSSSGDVSILICCVLMSPMIGLSSVARADCLQGCAGDTTYFGESALMNNTGGGNSAFGGLALSQNTTGYVNTAVGSTALFLNTTGIANTAVGAGALQENKTGFQNTATGQSALQDNLGSNNTADGYNALFFNTTGSNNTANGASAMGGNPDIQMTGSNNTASGYFALQDNTTGSNNTAAGANALTNNTRGSNNIALGNSAGTNLTSGNNNIVVGNAGVTGDSGVIRVGTTGTQTAAFIAGIRQTPITGAIAVGVDVNGQLGVRGSSARFKKDIRPLSHESETIYALRPVSFRYRSEFDSKGEPEFGLVAEDVEKVDPKLVALDSQGKPFTVRYEAVNAMLLNEFLKAHRRIEKMSDALARQEITSKAAAAEQQRQIDSLQAALKAQAAMLQKVSTKLDAVKAQPRIVAND